MDLVYFKSVIIDQIKTYEFNLLSLNAIIKTPTPVNEEDRAQWDTDWSTATSMERNLRLKIVNMNKILQKIENFPDEVGLCVDCGEDINEKRLIKMPTAVRCVECQENYENGGKRGI